MLEVKVNVQIGVTPEVVSLVSAILNKPAAVEPPQQLHRLRRRNHPAARRQTWPA